MLRRLLRILAAVVAGGAGLGIALGAVVARSALGPVRRFTERTEALTHDPDPSHRLDARRARRAGAARAQLQHDARRARALDRAAAQPRRGRIARAAHSARERAHERAGAGARRRPAAGRARGAAARDRGRSSPSCPRWSPTWSTWRAARERDEPREDVRLDELVRGVRGAHARAATACASRPTCALHRARHAQPPSRARPPTCSTTPSSGARPAAS